jgi:hypothetical protein
VADRIEGFLATLDTDLLTEARRTTALMFRELLLDAMSRGGTFDTNRRVRIACLRTARLLMYRIADAGYGFRAGDLPSTPERTTAAASSIAPPTVRPGLLFARELADEVLVNEAGDEVVALKYLG